MDGLNPVRQQIAVIGTGISGLSAAWLLAGHHDLTIYERSERIGGHTCTVDAALPHGSIPVDMGFIVYNENAYPNLTAMFAHLGVPTQPSDMSLSVSLDCGRLEYGGGQLSQLLAQKRNLVRPRFWSMLRDLVRFYREAPRDLAGISSEGVTLGSYLEARRYGSPFIDDHLLPMAGAIWSVPKNAILEFPAAAFIRFQENHGLLKLLDRPIWRTVTGGSRTYVERLVKNFRTAIRSGTAVTTIRRATGKVFVTDAAGDTSAYDHVIIAAHADQALAMLADPSPAEMRLLGAFRYNRNHAYLHRDPQFMPKRRAAWASWNYLGSSGRAAQTGLSVTYWMNRLQSLPTKEQLFVTLNPAEVPRDEVILADHTFEHPVMDTSAVNAQTELWTLQGQQRTWYCGAYFGAGFHEDGLQAGLAVAEALAGVRRPWLVADESGRITLAPRTGVLRSAEAS